MILLVQMGGLVVRATEEERQKLAYLSDRHWSGVNELQELRKLHDEFLF